MIRIVVMVVVMAVAMINRIYLMMGSACNFHCRYCLQVPIKEDLQKKAVSPDLYSYIDKLVKIKDRPLRVVFWGGEPLLYWHIIEEFVLRYQDKISYGIVSNGGLLTKEKADFMERHGISYTLSHDGANTEKTRNTDVLKDEKIRALTEQIYPMLNAVISAENPDFNELFDYWEKNYPYCRGHVEMLHVTWDMPKDLRNVDLNVYRNGLKKFFASSVERIKTHEWGSKATAAVKLMRGVRRSVIKRPYHFPKCNQVERVLDVDLDGNIYVCHNSYVKVGHVNDDRTDYLNRYWEWLKSKEKPKCATCEIRHYCQGGCPLDITDEACVLQKILYEEAVNSYENNKDVWDGEIG